MADRIEEFWNDPHVIRLGANGWKVEILEGLLEQIDPDLYTGRRDDDFGKLVRAAVRKFQQYRLLDETGIVDPFTKAVMFDACENGWHPGMPFQHPTLGVPVLGPYHPELGWLPDVALGKIEAGDVSWFGGPNDQVDRVYGQAYISGAKSPRALLEKHGALVRLGLLRPDVGELDKWPVTTNHKGTRMRAGTSWALNPESWYIAMRWKKRGKGYINERNPRLLVWSEDTGQACTVLRTDWGPAKDENDELEMDLSPGALKHLGLITHEMARVCWALDDAAVGALEGVVP